MFALQVRRRSRSGTRTGSTGRHAFYRKQNSEQHSVGGATVTKGRFSHPHAGGLISFDIFPEGWDKTLCLDLLEREGLNAIYFFGNETSDVSESGDFQISSDHTDIIRQTSLAWKVLL